MINSMFDHEQKILSPVMFGAPALMHAASRFSVHIAVLGIMNSLNLTSDFYQEWYKEGMKRFGPDWGYVDLLGILYMASKWIKPKSYLEIGVAAGRSMSIVGSVIPKCEITGMDLFKQSRMDIPKGNLKAVNHQGHSMFIRGDSHVELPKLKGKQFDLILVDGDHTKKGAILDLQQVIPLLPRGGVLVFDDFCVGWLKEVWEETIKSNPRFSTAEYRESGAGVAVAVLGR